MKFLKKDEAIWKGIDYYIPLKSKWNDNKYGIPWQRKYAGKLSVGAMVWLCDNWKPSSYEDFYNMYISRCFGYDKRHRGRSLDELEEIAINWRNDVGDFDTPLSEYFDAIILHTIAETYIGVDFEKKAIKAMEDTDKFIIERGTDEEDSAMNIDFKVYEKVNGNKGKLLYFIQVKPLSFIVSDRGHTISDRINAFSKQKKGNEVYPNIPYYYLVYDGSKNKWISNPKTNRCRFTYDELVKNDGLGTPVRTAYMMRKFECDDLFNNN